jgi:hypothetical protein
VTDKERLIRAVRKDWHAGKRAADIVRKHGVTVGFVRYHTVDKEYERNRPCRKREAVRVDVTCRVCGDPASITQGAIDKRIRLNMGPYRCRYCGQYGKPDVQPIAADPDDWRRPEEILDGEYGVRHWAWNVVKGMSRAERRAIAALDIDAIRNVDESRPARHARPRREKQEFRAAPYAKLEVAFGAAARGEKEAA